MQSGDEFIRDQCRRAANSEGLRSRDELAHGFVRTTCLGVGFDPDDAKKNYIHLQGAFSTTLHAADATNAEGIASVLQASPQPPAKIAMFANKIRIAESDEALANIKAERLYQKFLEPTGISTLHWKSSGHKLHSVADKTWSLASQTLSGACAVLLTLQSSQQVSRLRAALEKLVRERVQLCCGEVSESATQYRRNVLDTFLPAPSHPRRRAVVLALASVCNGDWRTSKTLEHYCKGPRCCESVNDAVDKILRCVLTVAKTLRPQKLCRANWLQWAKPLSFVGILGHLHALLPDAYDLALRNTKAQSNSARSQAQHFLLCSSGWRFPGLFPVQKKNLLKHASKVQ